MTAPAETVGLVQCRDCTRLGWLSDGAGGFTPYCRIASDVPDPIRASGELGRWRRCPKWEKALSPKRAPAVGRFRRARRA